MILVLIIIMILLLIRKKLIETFINNSGYTNFLFNNLQLGQKHNMSYDIRGETPIKKLPMIWNYSTTIPIYNRGL